MSDDALATLGDIYAALPPALRAARAELWQRARAEGVPPAKAERWRYTPLAPRLQAPQRPAPQAVAAPAPQPPAGATRLLYVNGQAVDVPARWQSDGSAHRLSTGPDLINAALASGGIDIEVAVGKTLAPLYLVTAIVGEAASVHLRHRLRLGDNASATLYWEDEAGESAGLSTQTLEIELGRNAALRLVRLQRHAAGGSALRRSHARLQRDARLDYCLCEAGSGLLRHDIHGELLETGAAVQLNGVYAPHGEGHCDIFATIEHAAPDTRSRLDVRGLAMDAARGIFNGRVHVHREAQRTDSEQKLATLLLSPRAQLNAKPELEIYADDVKCAHGATTGQLDEDALYYLRSRGISLADARALLIGSFAAHALKCPDWPEVEARLLAAVDALLGAAQEAAA